MYISYELRSHIYILYLYYETNLSQSILSQFILGLPIILQIHITSLCYQFILTDL